MSNHHNTMSKRLRVSSHALWWAMAVVMAGCGAGEGSGDIARSSESGSNQTSGLTTDAMSQEMALAVKVTQTQAVKDERAAEGGNPRFVPIERSSGVQPVSVQLGPLSNAEFDKAAAQPKKSQKANSGKPVDAGKRRFLLGVARSTGWTASQSWQWQSAADGTQHAAVEVDTVNAAGVRLGLLLHKALPAGALLTVQASDAGSGYRYTGAELNQVLESNLAADGDTAAARTFWTPTIESAKVLLQVVLPRDVPVTDWAVSLPSVSHLRELARNASFFKASGTCNIDGPCVSPLPFVADAVALMEFTDAGSPYVCTGTLLADTAGTRLPYFLTAEHCINSQTVASTLATHWFNRSATCGSSTLNPNAAWRTNGAKFLFGADWATASDTSLLLLNDQPPAGATFAGWNVAAANTFSTRGWHHPSGDKLKTSLGQSATFDPTGLITTWSSGVTEGGSSGSGLFNADNQLIGQLVGGWSACTAGFDESGAPLGPTQPDFYGRFDYGYNLATQDWLNVRRQTLVPIRTRLLGDFNGDGRADLLWRTRGGLVNIAFMNGTTVLRWSLIDQFADNVAIMGAGDFNGDGVDDIVWRNMVTGGVTISVMNTSGRVASWLPVGQTPIPLNVALEGIGDFDGNGRADMLWRNKTTGNSVMSYHNLNGTVASWPNVSNYIDPVRTAAQRVGDINGDGRDDIVWRNTASGNVVISLMNGNVPNWISITQSPIPLTTVIEAVADFDNNGRSDILWRNTLTGRSLMSYHNTQGAVTSWPVVSENIATSVSALGAGDFNGDNRADIVWRNLSTGNTVFSLMNGATPTWVTMSPL
jgi:lysyl endopeptidase